jgi:RNA polymerase sigma-70 factor (sigma-E family)
VVRSDRGSGGDRDAFRVFATRVSPTLLRSAYLLTGDRGQAEDLLQVALWRVARNWAAIEGSPDAYADQVLINLSRDRRRRLSRRAREIIGADPPVAIVDDTAISVTQRDWMVQAICQLPRRQREVVVLRFLLDLSVQQTAAVLGASEGTVKSHTSRALSQLRGLLTEQPEESDHLIEEVRHGD